MMNHLMPIFMKLENHSCLVVGGGKIACQKIKQLLDAKATVTVVSPKIINQINQLPVKIRKRDYQSSDVLKKKIVIAATDDNKINHKIHHDAINNGILVNIVDQPDLCSFYMGSVYKDDDLKIAISTNGKCPTFGIYLRNHVKNISKGLWGQTLKGLALKREKIIQSIKTYSEKKESVSKMMNSSFCKTGEKKSILGKVLLVGAGPGDPELITAKGLRAIQNANVILHDALIHPHLVFEINPIAQKIFVGKREDKHSVSQETIHSIMVEEVNKGHNVVRLKGGDPFIFGRGGEEIVALAKEKIPFEVIPGVTAGLGAAAGFGIPLTHRDEATSTLFITGHQCNTSNEQDWQVLATLHSTLVFYMGMRRLKEIVFGLTNNGKSGNTPIAIIQNATLKSQKIILSTLSAILEEVNNHEEVTPAIIIIGKVVNHYAAIKNCLDVIPSDMFEPMGDLGFGIWQRDGMNA